MVKAADHDLLPQPTTDVIDARQNLDELGYCLVDSALDADRGLSGNDWRYRRPPRQSQAIGRQAW